MTRWLVALVVALAASMAMAEEVFHVEASRDAVVRDRPDVKGDARLRLARGDRLNAVTDRQTDRFYMVFLPDGTSGWVSSFIVRLHRGYAPDALAPPPPPAPGVPTGLTAADRENAAFHFAIIGKPAGYAEIIRRGYAIGYSPFLKIPVWVQYRLTERRSEDDTYPRSGAFDEDAGVPPQARSVLADYEGSGYDRGHMAPADDMRWNDEVERESNLLTNMAPQVGGAFNSSVWKTLETRVRGWAKDRDDLVVIVGPIFDPVDAVRPVDRQPATPRQFVFNAVGDAVAVPTHFFKIVVDLRNPQRPEALAFVMPHVETQPGPERDIDTHLTTVDEVERRTGIDFLSGLPDELEERVESARPPRAW